MLDFLLHIRHKTARHPHCVGTYDDNILEKRLCEVFTNSRHLLGRELKWALEGQLEQKLVPVTIKR